MAHLCEEASQYESERVGRVVWIEANPELYQNAYKKYKDNPDHLVIEAAVFDKNDQILTFNISNNTQSSSLLNFDTHQKHHPDIVVTRKITVTTITLDALDAKYNFQNLGCNFLNIDLQGVEMQALKGFESGLSYIDYIFTEINFEPLYEGGTLYHELDAYLESKGFTRVFTVITEQNYGDALYLRNQFVKNKTPVTLTYEEAKGLQKPLLSRMWRTLRGYFRPKRQI